MDTRKLKGKSVKMEYSVWDDLLSTRRFWGIYKNLGIPVLDYIVQDWSSSGMQGRGKIAAAPTSDAAMPLPACRCRVLFFFFLVSRLAPTRCRLEPIRAESGRISRNHRYRRRTNRFRPKFKKKKKGAKCTVWTKTLYLSISVHFSSSNFSSLSLSASMVSVLHATASHLSHTISLSRVSTLNSLTLTLCSLSPLRYQSQAFNLSFS